MNQTKKMKLGLALSGFALTAALGAPAVNALAATPVSTDVEVVTAAANPQDYDDENISWSAPTSFRFAVKAGGDMITPSEEVLLIKNQSVFPIHLTRMQVTAQDPFKLVDDVESTEGDNLVQFTINGYKAAGDRDISDDIAFNMTYAGSETDHVNLDITAAKLKNSKEDVSTPKKVAQIVWTVAAGEAETK